METADDPYGLGSDGSAARFAIRRLGPRDEAFYAASCFERGGEGDQGVLMLLGTKPDGDRT